MDDAPPTLGERYTAATTSSNLRMRSGRCDADLLTAAGWLEDRLGALLLRLAGEHDAVKRDSDRLRAEFEHLERLACELDRRRQPEDAKRIRDEARRRAVHERRMVMLQLKTLQKVKAALLDVALERVEAIGAGFTWTAVEEVVDRVLDIHLDPTCASCQGRGKNGGYGAPQLICMACNGGGRRETRRLAIGAAGHALGEYLLDAIGDSVARATGGMRRAVANS